jgi:hypothetical protein
MGASWCNCVSAPNMHYLLYTVWSKKKILWIYFHLLCWALWFLLLISSSSPVVEFDFFLFVILFHESSEFGFCLTLYYKERQVNGEMQSRTEERGCCNPPREVVGALTTSTAGRVH